MTETLDEVCCLVIEDLYGRFLAEIFSHLTRNGRLAAQQLAQKCRIHLRQVKAGLATLIQLQLVYHHTNSEGQSTYQANIQRAYELLRKGKLITLVKETYGTIAATLVEELSVLGFVTVSELETKTRRIEDNNTWNWRVNGMTNTISQDSERPDRTRPSVRYLLRRLLQDRFITTIHVQDFRTNHDVRQDASVKVNGIGLMTLPRSKKEREDVENKINVEVQNGLGLARGNDTNGLVNGIHPLTNGDGLGNSIQPLEENCVIGVNYSNVAVALRNDTLIHQAKKTFGETSAKITSTALQQIALGLDGMRTSIEIPGLHLQTLDTDKMLHDLDELSEAWPTNSLPLVNGWHTANEQNDQAGKRKSSQLIGHAWTEKSNILKHLGNLAETVFPFLEQGSIDEAWKIDKEKLASFLNHQEILKLMSERLNPAALRIVRMLIDKGKLDENTLQELGLLGAKDLRQNLAQLETMGFLELQEVPREPQRQPNRTIFLWFFDADRVRRALLRDLYKSISRILQILHLEQERLASTLSKVERSDVKGSEEQMLSNEELIVLQRWRKKEEWLLGEIGRLDDSVILLRDL